MLTYHLRRVALPRLVVVIAVVAAVLWFGFRPGGTETGAKFTIWGIARYWAVVTPVLVILLVPMLGRLWQARRMHLAWATARPTNLRAVVDCLVNLWCGCAVLATFIVALAVYAGTRLPADRHLAPTLISLTVVGPVLGGYFCLAIGQAAALRFGSSSARITTVTVIAIIDAANQLPIAALSLSGTSQLTSRRGVWLPGLVDGNWRGTVHPDAHFLLTRLGLCLLATAAVAWQARRMNVRLGP